MTEGHLSETGVLALLDKIDAVQSEMAKIIVGQHQVVRELLISLLAGGHCMLEGVPGLAKTLMVSTLAKTLQMDFRRVQFTPDLMPSDLIGTEILEEDHGTGKRVFRFRKGPIFTQVLLADEINRTPAKTQAALLEAMQERAVSYGGETHVLSAPFFVLATQNPVEQAGTYTLPEAQLDRFLLYVKVDYPSLDDEVTILRKTTASGGESPQVVLSAQDVVALQSLVREVSISDALLKATTALVRSTRPDEDACPQVRQYVRWGAGPRAGQALILCAKAHALLERRFAVTLDDIRAVAPSALRHRLLLNYQAEADGIRADTIIDAILADVQLPIPSLI